MSAEQTIMIESLDDFVRLLSQWHSDQVAMIKHFQEIPDGTEITEDDGAPIIITGDIRKGFILGLKTALAHIGELPFEAEMIEVPQEPESEPAQQSLDLDPAQVTH